MLSSGGTRGEMATGGAVSLSRRFPRGWNEDAMDRWWACGRTSSAGFIVPGRTSRVRPCRRVCRAGPGAMKLPRDGLAISIFGLVDFEIFNGN